MMLHTTLSHADRVALIERHLAGESLDQIAATMHVSFYTVRTYWRRYRDAGWDAIRPVRLGPPPTGPLGRAHPRVTYGLLRLKRQHRGWGVDKLRLELTRRPSLAGLAIPRRSALAAYLAQFGARLRVLRRRPTHHPAAPALPPTTQPHQRWQMDFTGTMVVAGGVGAVAPFMVCDTASGAPLAGIIHQVRSRGNRAGVSARTVQADLRQVFRVWGLPDAVQMDHDSVFIGGTRLEWPGLVLLWLVGLGVQPIINRAARPTENAIVERHHQTWTAHVVVDQRYADGMALQAATDAAVRDRQQALPSRHRGCQGQPPAVAFPTLGQPRRTYHPDQEAAQFDLRRVDAYLAQWRWERVVDCTGKISLNNHSYLVGRAYAGQVVRVHFAPADRRCHCHVVGGAEIRQITIAAFSQAAILGVHRPDPSTGGDHRRTPDLIA